MGLPELKFTEDATKGFIYCPTLYQGLKFIEEDLPRISEQSQTDYRKLCLLSGRNTPESPLEVNLTDIQIELFGRFRENIILQRAILDQQTIEDSLGTYRDLKDGTYRRKEYTQFAQLITVGEREYCPVKIYAATGAAGGIILTGAYNIFAKLSLLVGELQYNTIVIGSAVVGAIVGLTGGIIVNAVIQPSEEYYPNPLKKDFVKAKYIDRLIEKLKLKEKK